MLSTMLLWPVNYLISYFQTQEADDDFWDGNSYVWALIAILIGVILGGFVFPMIPFWIQLNFWLKVLCLLGAYVVFGWIMWTIMSYKPSLHSLVSGQYPSFAYVGQILVGVGFLLYALAVRLFI